MNPINILIADDHPFFRDGMRTLLSTVEGFHVDEACNGKDAVEKATQKEYDLIIMDIKMPVMNGIEATLEIKKAKPEAKVLAMSMFDEQPYIVKMMRAGASGYLLKNSCKDELVKAIMEIVESNNNYFSKDVSDIMMAHIIEGKPIVPLSVDPDNVSLTQRELEIIKMVAEEQTNVEIGEALGISPRTVDTHRRNLLQKLKVKNSAGLVKFAIKNKLL